MDLASPFVPIKGNKMEEESIVQKHPRKSLQGFCLMFWCQVVRMVLAVNVKVHRFEITASCDAIYYVIQGWLKFLITKSRILLEVQ